MSIPRAPLHEKLEHYAPKLRPSVLLRWWFLHFRHAVDYYDQLKVLTSAAMQAHACVCECVYNRGFIEISPNICLGWRSAQWLDVGVMERKGCVCCESLSLKKRSVLAFVPPCLLLHILSFLWIFLHVIFCVWVWMILLFLVPLLSFFFVPCLIPCSWFRLVVSYFLFVAVLCLSD